MKKLILTLGIICLPSLSIAGVCKSSLQHSIVPTGSQTIINGCDSRKVPYKALVLTYYTKADMLKSVRILLDSRETSDRLKAEKKISLLANSKKSKNLSRKIRDEVLSELKLALHSSNESEQNGYIHQGTENLKKILTE